jgi:hypothetical protein
MPRARFGKSHFIASGKLQMDIAAAAVGRAIGGAQLLLLPSAKIVDIILTHALLSSPRLRKMSAHTMPARTVNARRAWQRHGFRIRSRHSLGAWRASVSRNRDFFDRPHPETIVFTGSKTTSGAPVSDPER